MAVDTEEVAWKAVGGAVAILAAMLARNLLQGAWKRARSTDPPANPADPTVDWGEAVTWAALTGAVIGVARMLASRWAAEGWRATVGDYPPGLQEVQ